jgi:serine/threonine protein kinase
MTATGGRVIFLMVAIDPCSCGAMTPLLSLIRSSSTCNGSNENDDLNDNNNHRVQDALDREILSANSSISFTSVRSSGPPTRPLDFPAPVLDNAIIASADIIDHTTGQIFQATILKRRPASTHHHRELSKLCINESREQEPEKAYRLQRKIRSTTYGSIRLCVVLKRVSSGIIPQEVVVACPEWETTSEMVAIKVARWSQLQSLHRRHLDDPIKEIAALQLLGVFHPHIISILDALQTDTHLYCVLPYMSHTYLVEKLAASPTGLSEVQARIYFRQILCGISQLQKKGICHRDICIENMVVDENNMIHIIDFGLALRIRPNFVDSYCRLLISDVSANTCRWRYVAPEVKSRSAFIDGFAIDLWSAGIVLFELLVGKKPFRQPDQTDKNFKQISVNGNLVILLQSKGVDISDDAMNLLQHMLWSDPAKRMTLSQIVNHPWVEGRRTAFTSSNENDEQQHWFIKTKSIDDLDHRRTATNSTFFTEYTDLLTDDECSQHSHHVSIAQSCRSISIDLSKGEDINETHQNMDLGQKKRRGWRSWLANSRASLMRRGKNIVCFWRI